MNAGSGWSSIASSGTSWRCAGRSQQCWRSAWATCASQPQMCANPRFGVALTCIASRQSAHW